MSTYINPVNIQDWKTVVWTKPVPKAKQQQIDPKFKKLNELDNANIDNSMHIDRISKEFCQKIIKLRNDKKLSQKQLANSLNLKEDIIKSIENGSHKNDKLLFNKIINFLSK